MFKFSLLLFFVSSALFCQANPTALNQPSSDTPLTPDKQSNLTSSAPVVILRENNGSEGGSTISPKLDSKIPAVSEAPQHSPKFTNSSPPPKTTSSTSTQSTTSSSTESTTSSSTQSTTHPTTQSTTHPTTQSTTHPTTSAKSTTVPTPTTVPPKPSSDGGFNLISFLGGMILGLGLLAIGYVIFKFYQTRRDSSYRTL